MIGWFGKGRAAQRVNDGAPEVPVPVGEDCIGCDGKILETDRGFVLPFSGAEGDPRTHCNWHRRCFMEDLGFA